MKKRVIIPILMLIIIVLFVIIFLNIFKEDDKITKNKVVNGILFSEADITKSDDGYKFKVKLDFNDDKAKNAEHVDIIIKTKKGKEIDTLSGYIGGLNKGENIVMEMISEKDLSKAYEVIYTVYNE